MIRERNVPRQEYHWERESKKKQHPEEPHETPPPEVAPSYQPSGQNGRSRITPYDASGAITASDGLNSLFMGAILHAAMGPVFPENSSRSDTLPRWLGAGAASFSLPQVRIGDPTDPNVFRSNSRIAVLDWLRLQFRQVASREYNLFGLHGDQYVLVSSGANLWRLCDDPIALLKIELEELVA